MADEEKLGAEPGPMAGEGPALEAADSLASAWMGAAQGKGRGRWRAASCVAASVAMHAAALGALVLLGSRAAHAPATPLPLTSLSVRINLGQAPAAEAKPEESKPEQAKPSEQAASVHEPSDDAPAAAPRQLPAEKPPAQADGQAKPEQAVGVPGAGQPSADRAFADEVSWPDFSRLGKGSFSFSMAFGDSGEVASLEIIATTYQDESLAALRRLLMSAKAPRAGRVDLEMDVDANPGAGDPGAAAPPALGPEAGVSR